MRVFHLTEAKSGSQWVTGILSDPRVMQFAPGMRFERWQRGHPLEHWARQPDGLLMGAVFGVTFDQWEHFRRPGDKAVYVFRDPRDRAVSEMFSYSYSHMTLPVTVLIRPVLLSLSMRRRMMAGFFFLPWRIVRSWGARERTESEYPVRFEEILADEAGAFRAIFDFLAWPVPDEVVREVVESHSFEKKSRGRSRGEADTYSHFRRGVAGDWRNYFDRGLGEMFERAYPHLLVELGYEKSDDWYVALPETVPALAQGDDLNDMSLWLTVAQELEERRSQRMEAAILLREGIAALDRLADSP